VVEVSTRPAISRHGRDAVGKPSRNRAGLLDCGQVRLFASSIGRGRISARVSMVLYSVGSCRRGLEENREALDPGRLNDEIGHGFPGNGIVLVAALHPDQARGNLAWACQRTRARSLMRWPRPSLMLRPEWPPFSPEIFSRKAVLTLEALRARGRATSESAPPAQPM